MDSQVAAKAVIVNSDNKVLIMKNRDRWEAPGGRLESGETLRQGLAREIEEEAGIIDLQVGEIVHVDEWFSKPEGETKHIVAVFFACKVDSDKVRLSDEHQDYAWITPDELDTYVAHPEIGKAIQKAWTL